MSETTATAAPAPTPKRVFKSHIPSCNFIFSNGKPAIFVGGKYITDNENEIQSLEYEIKQGHPHLFIDPDEREVAIPLSGNELVAGLRAKIIAELEAEGRLASDPGRDMGSSDQSQVKPANSQDVAPAAAGGSGVQTMSLAALKAKVTAEGS